ncbi:glycoside hydrolase family 76 protein [Flavobacterium gilvum]|uniref:Glycosyl hydrolase family 76 n=1 Tax=Flavobacterium gilvum TaxID=1492737 RepID=A0AAC9I7L5_9FLAO|nr:glycoside hydrolase family 76 protein [Flavobacterium gilvum]AOW10776.1 hypothetical protein EM308_15475 [Flavobacterium gilvum]KFC58447.1 hypothetical protein FEM08_27710 [Flavobacterium gilvum]
MKRRNFVKMTGTFALLFPYTNVLSSIDFEAKEYYEADKLFKMSIAAFNRFESVWECNDFWRRGNTFDACLNFTDVVQQKWPDKPEVKLMQQKVNLMLEKNMAYFHSLDPNNFWADDFGWWGLMGLNARRYLLRAGNKELADKYLQLSTDLCWKQAKIHAYDPLSSAVPIPHGFRNGDAKGQSTGVKNTVTNVLFFLLSTRIYRLTLAEKIADNDKYLEMAYDQWMWFDSWFQLNQYEYLKKTASGGALVQERPIAIFEGSGYKDTTHPTWHKGWVWTGDQGMLLASLTNMLAIKDNVAEWVTKNKKGTAFNVNVFTDKINAYLELIAKGIKTTLISDMDHVIREAPLVANMGPEFGSDYLAGRGIMMRYLGILGGRVSGVDFKSNIKATANAIWETRDSSNNQFKAEYTNAEKDKLYIQQFKKEWGVADDILKWDIEKVDLGWRLCVCQSIGLDALGATIRLM